MSTREELVAMVDAVGKPDQTEAEFQIARKALLLAIDPRADSPLWAHLRELKELTVAKALYVEDDAHPPDYERIGAAFQRITGEALDVRKADETFDGGDSFYYLFKDRMLVVVITGIACDEIAQLYCEGADLLNRNAIRLQKEETCNRVQALDAEVARRGTLLSRAVDRSHANLIRAEKAEARVAEAEFALVEVVGALGAWLMGPPSAKMLDGLKSYTRAVLAKIGATK